MVNYLLWRAVLYIVGFLSVSLASTRKMPIAPPSFVTGKNVCKHYQMSPGEQNYSWLRTTSLPHAHIPMYMSEILWKWLQKDPPCLPWYLKNKGNCEGMDLYTDPLCLIWTYQFLSCCTFNTDTHIHTLTCTHTLAHMQVMVSRIVILVYITTYLSYPCIFRNMVHISISYITWKPGVFIAIKHCILTESSFKFPLQLGCRKSCQSLICKTVSIMTTAT